MRRWRPVILGCLAGIVGAAVWLYATPYGFRWRIERMGDPELLQHVLSHPDDSFARTILGNRQYREGKYEEAATTFGSSTPEFILWRARALIQAGKLDDALTELTAAEKEHPGDPAILTGLGTCSYLLGNPEQARDQLERVQKGSANVWAVALAARAFVEADSHQLDKAAQLAGDSIQARPDAADGYIALGYALSESGRRAEALQSLDQAVALEPHNRRALLLRASIAVRGGTDAKNASLLLDKAESEAPQAAEIPYLRGLGLMASQEPLKAADQFREALKRRPGDTDSLYNLSLALAQTGDAKGAAEVRRRFEAWRDYDRTVGNLKLRISRDPRNQDLLLQLLKAARSHGDSSLVTLVVQRLNASVY